MNILYVTQLLLAAAEAWKSYQANSGPDDPKPEYLEAQKQARKAMMIMAESFAAPIAPPS